MGTKQALSTNEIEVNKQRKLLLELIDLKTQEIERREYRNFYGNVEEIAEKQREVHKMIENFTRKVERTFPGILTD